MPDRPARGLFDAARPGPSPRAARGGPFAAVALLALLAAFGVAAASARPAAARLPWPSFPAPLGSLLSPVIGPVQSLLDPVVGPIASALPSLPLPRLPLPTPTLPLPTPTLPLPTPTLPRPTLPLPTPTLPRPTPEPSLEPSPLPSSSPSESPSLSPAIGAPTTVSSPPPRPSPIPTASSAGGSVDDPPTFLGLSVPALAIGVTGLLLTMIILFQALGAAVWLAVVRRVMGSFQLSRPRRPEPTEHQAD